MPQFIHELQFGARQHGKTREIHALSRRAKCDPCRSLLRHRLHAAPEAKDVPWLMEQLIAWINKKDELPVPIKAGIAHYQYAIIHP